MIIGRKREKEELEKLYNSPNAEFVAVYGRRRVGKTFLINETFEDRITFRHTGLSPADIDKTKSGTKEQLKHFYNSLLLQGMARKHVPHDWLEAFLMLEQFLMSKDTKEKQIVFLDELPWLDTPRSGFITALEGFWNNWGTTRKNLLLIVCGSANSWIINKLINNHGGLYNRVSYEIKLMPFTLHETREFLQNRGVKLSEYDITQAYMIAGGIPYYLGYMTGGESLAENVDRMFFRKEAKLNDEFNRLFSSVFDTPDLAMAIVRILNKRSIGYERKDIMAMLKKIDNSNFTKTFNALEASNFILRYVPFGMKKTQVHYKLIDPFCIFYLRFIENKNNLNEDFWMMNVSSPSVSSWRGYAFENVCFNHIKQIKKALGISGVQTECSQWHGEGTQIDLLIERKDDVLNMCEIKFYGTDFAVDKEYSELLGERQLILSSHLKKKTVIHNTLITTSGLKYNAYSGVFSKVITLDDLFDE